MHAVHAGAWQECGWAGGNGGGCTVCWSSSCLVASQPARCVLSSCRSPRIRLVCHTKPPPRLARSTSAMSGERLPSSLTHLLRFLSWQKSTSWANGDAFYL